METPKPPEAVVQAIQRAYPNVARYILQDLKYNGLSDYWYFTYAGLYVGVERDGYIHT